jgi:hypothetical protein
MPVHGYLPSEGFVNLKKVYDSESLQDHWFFVRWGLGRGGGEEFVLPARTKDEALAFVQARLREFLGVNTTGSWAVFELGVGPRRLTVSMSMPSGSESFWTPDIRQRADAIRLDTVESIRVVLDNEIARFDALQRQFEKWVTTNEKGKKR